MKFYLSSSYRIDTEESRLKEMTSNGNKHVAFIHNALDYGCDLERRNKSVTMSISDLENWVLG